MNKNRLSLDDPAFAGRLRYAGHRNSYAARPIAPPMKAVADADLLIGPADDRLVVVDEQHIKQIQQFIQPFQLPVQQSQPAGRPITTSSDKDSVLATTSSVSPFVYQPGRIPDLPWQSTSIDRTPIASMPTLSKKKLRRQQPIVLYAMAAVIFTIGLTVSLNGLRANRQVSAQVQRLAVQSTKSDGDDNGAAPSIQKPSNTDINNYAVAPNLPRFVDIAKLGVHARILSMGVTGKNQLKAPGNVFDAGWYNASAQPGQPGGMLLDGHISSWTTKGVFYGLNKLTDGDQITITRGDGQKFSYTVVKRQLFDADKVDMQSMLVSQDPAKPGLNLISCSGEVIPGTNEFDKRIVIYAVMQ